MVTYTAKDRTSLKAIAREYGFSDWHPIWNYNTKISENLHSTNPDAPVEAGTKIVVPPTAEQYDHMIGTIDSLKKQVHEDMTITLRQLEEAKKSADRFGAVVDFAADLAMIFCGSGVKAIRYSGIVRRQQLAKTAVETLQKTTAFLGHYEDDGPAGDTASKAGEALAKEVLRRKASTLARASSKEFAKGMVEVQVKHHLGEVAGLVATLLLEGTEDALKAIQPSQLAQGYLRLKTGESPEKTYCEAVKLAKYTADESAQRLKQSISRLQNEKTLVYGAGATGANARRVANAAN